MTDAGETFREARAAVGPHLKKQADAELAATRWGQEHPRASYDDPEWVALRAAAEKAQADVIWCRAVEVACAEIVKGVSLDEAIAHNNRNRHKIKKHR